MNRIDYASVVKRADAAVAAMMPLASAIAAHGATAAVDAEARRVLCELLYVVAAQLRARGEPAPTQRQDKEARLSLLVMTRPRKELTVATRWVEAMNACRRASQGRRIMRWAQLWSYGHRRDLPPGRTV